MALRKSVLIRLVEKITVHGDRVAIHLKDGDSVFVDYRFSMQGMHRQMVVGDQSIVAMKNQKHALLKAYLQGYVWRRRFFEEPGTTIAVLVKEESKGESYITRLINFSLMAPDLVMRILKGDIPAHITRQSLMYDLPISWAEQRRRFEEGG